MTHIIPSVAPVTGYKYIYHMKSWLNSPVWGSLCLPNNWEREHSERSEPTVVLSLKFLFIRECGSTLYVGLARAVPPTNTNFRLTFLLARFEEALYEDLPVESIKFEVYHHFSGLSFKAEVNFWRPTKTVISCDFFIRECGSTLYVWLACAVSHTNTKFRLTFLLTRLQEALYEDLPAQSIKFEVYHHFSGLCFIAEVNFWHPWKTVVSCDLFIIIIIIFIIFINFFRRVFSEYTEAVTTSLIPIDAILPEISYFYRWF